MTDPNRSAFEDQPASGHLMWRWGPIPYQWGHRLDGPDTIFYYLLRPTLFELAFWSSTGTTLYEFGNPDEEP